MPPPVDALLDWYARHRRRLAWREGARDPYHVWLSEVMLQQTTVAAAGPRLARFLARFPTVQALAAAPEAAVMEEWAGLGYYARARNLHACARAVAATGFPASVAALRALPGIGAYTAAAVGAIAFGLPVVPLDGNVERILARWHGIATPLPAARPRLDALAQALMAAPAARAQPGALAQALFDLGATTCTARTPVCALCPWAPGCAGLASGAPAALPVKPAKRDRPLRHGSHFLLRDAAGLVLVRRRPPEGLLGGMLELPGTPWRETPWPEEEALAHAPLPDLAWTRAPGLAEHGFTHFRLHMALFVANIPTIQPNAGMETRVLAELPAALPTAFRRVLALAPAPA